MQQNSPDLIRKQGDIGLKYFVAQPSVKKEIKINNIDPIPKGRISILDGEE